MRISALLRLAVTLLGLFLCAGFALPASANPDTVVQITNRNTAAIVPASVTVLKGETCVYFDVRTLPVTQKVLGSLFGTLDGNSVYMSLTVRPVSVDALTVSGDYVPEGSRVLLTLPLEVISPYDTTVTLQSDTPNVVSVPPSVVIPTGSLSAGLTLVCGAVSANTRVIITASAAGLTRTVTLTVRPMRIISVNLSASSVTGGSAVSGTLNLEGPAPAGGKTVALSSNAVCMSVPTQVFVPAGQATAQFAIQTSTVAANASAILEASVPTVNAFAALVVRAH